MVYRKYIIIALSAFTLSISAANRTETVQTVTTSVTLNDAVDYIVTGASPFGANGSINIENDDAVVIFPNLKPSFVYNTWIKRIYVKGKTGNRQNAWAGIYDNGSIVYPHPKEDFSPLTVFKETDFKGESRNDFMPFNFYNNVSALGSFENQIRSFKLKRGYMVTLACNYDGTGYSRVFIAQDADVEVAELQRELSGRIAFIRIFPWNRVTKKGCGAFDWNPNNLLNVQWGYDWGAGGSPFADDVDYVGMHHHEDWPSYNEIGTARSFNTVLGNNEPDNLNDPSQNPIPAGQMEAVLFGENGLTGSWRNIYKGGYRVGSPAMAGDYDFLRQFMDLCQKYNYRIDFIATHRYQMGSGWDYDWFVNWIYDQYHLPVWITEWNYGAEWNGNLDAGPEFFRDQIASIIPILENNPHLERQAFFNVLGDVNRMMTNRHAGMSIMPAGEWYRDYKSKTAYTGGEGYIMRWNYWAPSDLTATLDNKSKTVSLSWLNLNGKQTDSTLVERRLPGEAEWTVINRRYLQGNAQQIMRSDTLNGIGGLITYRVRNFDSDGRIRISNEAEVSVGSAKGNAVIQYGAISLTDPALAVKVDFTQTLVSVPSVFIGPMSDNNSTTNISPLFTSGSITNNGFTFTPQVWGYQPNGTTTFSKTEEVDFIAIPQGNYRFGNVAMEVGTVLLHDTTRVEFNEPFEEGVTPVVALTANRVTQKDQPLLSKVWDIDNKGFTCVVAYEDGLNRKVLLNQQLAYLAVTPGQACVDEEKGILISAGHGQRKIYTLAREETFASYLTDEGIPADTLYFEDPTVLAQLQSGNTTVSSALRLSSLVEKTLVNDPNGFNGTFYTGMRLRRVLDLSSGVKSNTVDNSRTGDEAGWIAIHSTQRYQPAYTGIQAVEANQELSPLQIVVTGRHIKVLTDKPYQIYSLNGMRVIPGQELNSGIYIVRAGSQSAKVFIK